MKELTEFDTMDNGKVYINSDIVEYIGKYIQDKIYRYINDDDANKKIESEIARKKSIIYFDKNEIVVYGTPEEVKNKLYPTQPKKSQIL